jgi:hypothetical protein
VQERELSIIQEYESKLLAREEENAAQDLSSSAALSGSLARLSHILRQFLRSLGGEGVEQLAAHDDREPWTTSAAAQHALERECELARLEKENEELRLMLDMVGYDDGKGASEAGPFTFDPARMVASCRPEANVTGVEVYDR